MGGNARHLFVSLAIPRQMKAKTARSIYTGIKTACRMHNVNILGGDTSASLDRLMINVTVIGEAREKDVLYRNGARPGDNIYTTGTLGDSAAGLMLVMEEGICAETADVRIDKSPQQAQTLSGSRPYDRAGPGWHPP